jgi:hypothetical protein
LAVREELGTGQLPWAGVEVDLAEGLSALPAIGAGGEPVGGAFVLVRVFIEPIAGLWVAIRDAGLSAAELGRIVAAEAGDEVRDRLRSAGWRDDPAGLPVDGVVPPGRPAWLLARDAAEASSLHLTVALCTRDHPGGVRRCLASLQ